MPRKRNPKRDQAFEIYKNHSGAITNREIANELDIPEKTISAWKSRDKWLDKIGGKVCSTTKKKRSTAKRTKSVRTTKKEQVIDALVEAGTYSPALDLLIEIYLDCYEEYLEDRSEKLRKELAKYLGQLGLDGKNKELIKKNGKLLAKGDEEKKEEKDPEPAQNNKLLQFRQRMQR
ncbi:phage terminase small subunit-related protein [Gracilibacillus sp. D59]|uniref:phage terminase small subunit-related protein n=1 Tax=Gracilibacillus sp. D59 TaxID=3457434 RepID=UPI003FCC85CE